MFAVGLVRLTDPEILRGIGRDLLVKFLETFRPDLAAKNIPLPDPQAPDDAFFQSVATLLVSASQPEGLKESSRGSQSAETPGKPHKTVEHPEGVPDVSHPFLPSLREALCAIAEMSAPGAAERHRQALAETGFHVHIDPGCSPGHAAVKLWLAIPSLLAHLERGGVTLDPLRDDGPDALSPAGIKAIVEVRLTKLRTLNPNTFNERFTRKAADIFKSVGARSNDNPIPNLGTLSCAVFNFYFCDSPQPHRVKICPPNKIKFDHPFDVIIVGPWMFKHHFLNRSLAA